MRKKENNKSLIGVIIFLLLICVSIGYAALSSSLAINGTTKISQNKWDVHLESVAVTSGSVTPTTAATVGSNKLSVSYAVNLKLPGEFYEFTVNVKNGGTIPAKLSATPTVSGVSTAQDVYTNYTVRYSDGSTPASGNVLAAGASKTIRVRVEYDKNISASQLPTTDQNLSLTFSMNYVQA